MKLSAKAERDHQRLVEHIIQSVTEQFRPTRAAELDDGVVKDCKCGGRFITPPCPYCGAHG